MQEYFQKLAGISKELSFSLDSVVYCRGGDGAEWREETIEYYGYEENLDGNVLRYCNRKTTITILSDGKITRGTSFVDNSPDKSHKITYVKVEGSTWIVSLEEREYEGKIYKRIASLFLP